MKIIVSSKALAVKAKEALQLEATRFVIGGIGGAQLMFYKLDEMLSSFPIHANENDIYGQV